MLGLGRMGLPIATRLAAAPFPTVGFDSDPTVLAAAQAVGLDVAIDGRALAASCDVVITVLPGPVELAAAMGGPGGALARMPAGACWLDLTSGDPRLSDRLADEAAARGVLSVAAPMIGGAAAARDGSLRFSVGGDAQALDRVRPILAALGPRSGIDHVGSDVGSGQTAKLLGNLLWFGQVVAVTEALLLGQRLGLEPQVLRDTLASGPGGSAFIDRHLDALLAGDYLPDFGIHRCLEELQTLQSLAAAAQLPWQLSDVVTRLHADALERFGSVGGELLAAKLLEERASTTLRSALDDSAGRDGLGA